MSSTSSGARANKAARRRVFPAPVPSPLVASSIAYRHSFLDFGAWARAQIVLEPRGREDFSEQLEEVLSSLRTALKELPETMAVVVQTLFLNDSGDRELCERMVSAHYGPESPVTSYVFQPPCSGAAVTIEALAVGGGSVSVERFGAQTLALSCERLRWVYFSGFAPDGARGAYVQTLDALKQMRYALNKAGSGFEHVVRTWFYLGGITEREAGTERYKELNRARTDFYRDVRFCRSLPGVDEAERIFPSSTCIGAAGSGLAAGCMTLETGRKDILLIPLENPLQTPASSYGPSYSAQSPKFSRAMALAHGDHVSIWVSGTASIVDSESRHPGDVEKQTEQAIDNIERLVSRGNFASHGVSGVDGSTGDFAGIRVYLKRPGDFIRCKAVCKRRFGPVPAVYTVADVCRPELLVEIEGVAFTRRSRGN